MISVWVVKFWVSSGVEFDSKERCLGGSGSIGEETEILSGQSAIG